MIPNYEFIESTEEFSDDLGRHPENGITNFFKVSAESAKKRNLKCFYFVYKLLLKERSFVSKKAYVRDLYESVWNYISFKYRATKEFDSIVEEVLGQYWWLENEDIAIRAFKNSLYDYKELHVPLEGYKIEPVVVDLTKLDFTKKHDSEKAFGEYVVSQYKEIEPFMIYREGGIPNGQEKEAGKEEKEEEKS